MPDLAMTSVLDWLKAAEPDKPALAASLVSVVEAAPGVEEALVRLGHSLDQAVAKTSEVLPALLTSDPGRQELRTIMGQIGLPRCLRIIHWILQDGPQDRDAVLAAVLEADLAGAGQFLQASLCAVARPSLLERLYAPERLALLLGACQPAVRAQEAA
ncbi:hypothetical protein HN018_23305 (plasmid) [Lichenicola cladoniae]|uniref:Uncharacterized protein n=1 Tax=Lichenicola cladoniae TaxID=1484109 RepID=A0A6M8HY69_9PROT|nr:hypothetical protein [Lichenicola cladoniae]NPD66353.1 hypothetical protein [Acetobacteraceae bacterium]QKE93115.1 hypothetical protein HN018_23305 [Lichenicola cladoniae]